MERKRLWCNGCAEDKDRTSKHCQQLDVQSVDVIRLNLWIFSRHMGLHQIKDLNTFLTWSGSIFSVDHLLSMINAQGISRSRHRGLIRLGPLAIPTNPVVWFCFFLGGEPSGNPPTSMVHHNFPIFSPCEKMAIFPQRPRFGLCTTSTIIPRSACWGEAPAIGWNRDLTIERTIENLWGMLLVQMLGSILGQWDDDPNWRAWTDDCQPRTRSWLQKLVQQETL